SLFNALAGGDRAIVTPLPGTTRDLITEMVEINGLRITLIDSAGLRETDDVLESAGVKLARKAMNVADAVLLVVDGSNPLDETDVEILRQTIDCTRVVVANKCDVREDVCGGFLPVSAKTGAGLQRLRDELTSALDVEPN